jgi:hypothetical protein
MLHWRLGHKKECARLKAKTAKAAEEAAEAEATKKGEGEAKNVKNNTEGGGESKVSSLSRRT